MVAPALGAALVIAVGRWRASRHALRSIETGRLSQAVD
jgi:hypothetical protein